MKRFYGIAFVILLSASSLPGQVPFFQNYYLLRKNDPVQINTIFQGRTGFIWFGTNKGLFKFDGLNYRRYTHDDSLPDINVTAIAQDSVGRIWIGCKNGKIAYIERNQVHLFEPREGSSTAQISDILFDRNGNLWFSTLDDGLYYLLQDRLYRLDDQEGLPDLFIYDLIEDRTGKIWAGTDGGIAICTLSDNKVSIEVVNYTKGLPDNIVKKFAHGDNKTLWIATEDAGVINFDPTTGKYTPLVKEWHYGSVTDFLVDGDQIWIACAQTGLLMYDIVTNSLKTYNENAGPGFTSITTMLKDLEGNTWFGTRTGVMRTPGDELEYIDSFGPAIDPNVIALTVDGQGAIWFSTGEGLFRRTVDEQGVAKIERQLVRTPYEKFNVISLFTDSAGYVWAGLYGEGAIRIHRSTGKITYLNKELRNGNILSITGRGNNVWFATLGGGVHVRIDGERLTVKNYGSDVGLSTDFIYQVFLDSKDRVWFATDGKGTDMLDDAGFHHYEKGLESKVVYGFAEDSDHIIWANVQNDGLYRLEGDTWQAFKEAEAFRDASINGFASDSRGNLLAMHDLGIDIYKGKQSGIRYLGEELGIRERKANLNAVAHDNQGHIYFGTDKGIIRYSERASSGQSAPRPIVSGIKVFDQEYDIGKELRFSYNQNDVTVNYLGLWYQNPANLSFQYRLENYDRDWISSRDHSVTYSSLPPGTYLFRLRTSETGNFKNATISSLQFVVDPPFWRTSWFYLLSAFVLTFLGYTLIRYRERALLKDKRILEARVSERTHEIHLKTEEIQAQNEAIHAQAEEIKGINENLENIVQQRTRELELKNKSLEEYAFINAHELRAPVASILGLINLMRKLKLDPEEKVYLDHLEKSAERLDHVCSEITKAIERSDSKT